jgi:hypothetical protein
MFLNAVLNAFYNAFFNAWMEDSAVADTVA